MQVYHYITMLFMSLNIFMLVRNFAQYFRFRHQGIPGMGYCLAFAMAGAVNGAVVTVTFLLPEGEWLEFLLSLASWSSILATTLFTLIVILLTGKDSDTIVRRRNWLLAIPLASLPVYATGNLHHLTLQSVTKHADGFLYDINFGPLNVPMAIISTAIVLLAIIRVFRLGARSIIKEARVRWLLVFTSVMPIIISGLEAVVPLLNQLRVSMFFVWVQVSLICYLFFGYLLTARQMAIEVMNDCYVVFDLRGNCVDINPKAAEFFERYCGTRRPRAEQLAGLFAQGSDAMADEGDIELPGEEGSKYYRVSSIRLSNGLNQYCGNGFSIREITEYMVKMSHLDDMANEDPLTGAKNRRFLHQNGGAIMAAAVAAGRPVSVMMLDIDFFKRVNDVYGHAAGDEVLSGVCAVMRRSVRDDDIIVRYGGEEFVVVSEGRDADSGQRMAERIRAAVERERFTTAEGEISVTISVGVFSGVPGPADTIDSYVAVADQNLYKAKQTGRNKVIFGGFGLGDAS